MFFLVAACALSLGPNTLKAICFPLCLLIFAVPFPVFLVERIETFLQYASADGADLCFSLTGMSFLRQGLLFRLPGIHLEVAPECSGIHSTLVLFITSLIAGQLFLGLNGNAVCWSWPWCRWELCATRSPLGLSASCACISGRG